MPKPVPPPPPKAPAAAPAKPASGPGHVMRIGSEVHRVEIVGGKPGFHKVRLVDDGGDVMYVPHDRVTEAAAPAEFPAPRREAGRTEVAAGGDESSSPRTDDLYATITDQQARIAELEGLADLPKRRYINDIIECIVDDRSALVAEQHYDREWFDEHLMSRAAKQEIAPYLLGASKPFKLRPPVWVHIAEGGK